MKSTRKLNFRYVGINIEIKQKKKTVVHSVLFKDSDGMTCHTLASVDLFFADAWKDLQRQNGLKREFEYYDYLGQQLAKH